MPARKEGKVRLSPVNILKNYRQKEKRGAKSSFRGRGSVKFSTWVSVQGAAWSARGEKKSPIQPERSKGREIGKRKKIDKNEAVRSSGDVRHSFRGRGEKKKGGAE